MPSFSQMSDAELLAWLKNFNSVVGANPADYGMTAAQITALQGKVTAMETNMTARVTAQEVLDAAIKSQQMSRGTTEPDCTYYNTIIKANKTIPEDKKVLAGIDPDKPPTFTPPVAPAAMIVNGFEDGTNMMKWDRTGNKRGTQYIIEYREAADTEFEFLGTTTATTYTHTGTKPGMQCAYRVKAVRAGMESQYSNVAVVYMV